MKRLSLQWRITIMTALLTCAACMLTNCLVGYTGMRYMDAIGSGISALSTADEDTPQAFDPTNVALDDEVTVVVNNAQESFGATAWCTTAGVTLLGGVLAYFVSGRALKPLRAFAAQVERVQPDNLSEINLSEDVPTELQRCSASFNDTIGRLDEGFSAQRQFTGNAAHELRTPLALMQAQIELFASEHPTSQPQTAELLGLLQEQTERMSRMTKVLLEMSELHSVPCEDDIELGPLSEEVLTDLAPLAEHKDIVLNCSGGALIIGSDTLLYRLVFNLVENAIRYSRPGSTVNVSICDNDSHVFLRVEDQGPGIPKQYRESIFQPFFRLDKSRSRAYGGAGLGLALVWEIAALHGGTVEVEASSENGATMLTTLPKRTAA
ncbi:MAG: ATP-binding protein [Eggerthella sp.]|uniref:sensor histidine kinase n=1 Tax=Eggerthella sp. TaxID=1929886 RepID=UPI00290FBCF9|nr:ATP-binding protein [Eggerthella sp.]MDU5980274.1 ATP-binding protein [Eggerthella sp.]MDU6386784.1 ATP-binding protein [Eggerthella sp.]